MEHNDPCRVRACQLAVPHLVVAACLANICHGVLREAVKWFAYDFLPQGDRLPKGELCWVCGSLGETVPAMTPEQIKAKLSSGTDLTFEVMWEVGKRRLKNEVPLNWRLGTVSTVTNSGLRCEWVYHFVEQSAFLKKTQHDMETRGLRLKTLTLTDPEGRQRTGALLRPEEVPPDLPFVRVTLYRDESLAHEEYFLNKPDSLNERHADNIFKYKVEETCKERSAALRLDAASQVPLWSEVEKEIATMEKALKDREAEELGRLGRVDAAALTGSAAEAKKELERAAAISAALSGAKINRPGLESASGLDFAADRSAAVAKQGAGGSASNGNAAGKRRLTMSAGGGVAASGSEKRRGGKASVRGGVGGLALFAADCDGKDKDREDGVEESLAVVVNKMYAVGYSPGRELRGVRVLVGFCRRIAHGSGCRLGDRIRVTCLSPRFSMIHYRDVSEAGSFSACAPEPCTSHVARAAEHGPPPISPNRAAPMIHLQIVPLRCVFDSRIR